MSIEYDADRDYSDYESGPFCRHFDDPSCDIKCADCGDRCTVHEMTEGETYCNECECLGWVEPEIRRHSMSETRRQAYYHDTESLTMQLEDTAALAAKAGGMVTKLYDKLTSAQRQITRFTEALTEIAAFDDEGANAHLQQTGSYSLFDEPGAVEVARTALGAVAKECE